MQAGAAGRKNRGMTAVAIGGIAVFLVVGTALGWHWQKSYAAHGDVKVAKNRLRGGRKTRMRSGFYALLIAIGVVLAFADFVRKH
jgi:hypothetical protein